MAEAFGIACHELVSLDVRCGSKPEVQRGPRNVGSWGQSGSRFRAAACLLVATSGPNAPVAGHGLLVQTADRWLTPSWWSWRTRWVNRNGTVFGSIATGALSSPCSVFFGDLSILTVPSRHADVYKLALMPMR